MTNDDAIKWLENLKQDIDQLSYEVRCHYEQAIDEICGLLKEHEPKVITREMLRQFVNRPCWFESHGTYMGEKGFWIIPYMFTCYETMYYVYPLMQTNDRNNRHYSELGLSAYNKAWRCWSSRPTDEQRKKVKWND